MIMSLKQTKAVKQIASDSPHCNPPQLRQPVSALRVDWRFALRNYPTNYDLTWFSPLWWQRTLCYLPNAKLRPAVLEYSPSA